MLNLHVVPDLLTLRERRHLQVPVRDGDTVGAIAWRHLDVRWLVPTPRVVAILNGRAIKQDEMRVPVLPGEDLTLVQVPAAPLVVLGGYSLTTLILASLAASVAAAAITGIVSYLLMRPQTRQVRGDDESVQYGWDGIDNSTGVGAPIPVLYGEIRTGLQVIQSYRAANRYGGPSISTLAGDKLNMLFAISEGHIYSIGGLSIDDYPVVEGFNQVTAYDAISNPAGIQDVQLNRNALTANLLPQAQFWGRFGWPFQQPTPGFHNTRIEYSVNEGFEAEAAAQETRVRVAPDTNFLQVLQVASTVGFYPNDRAVIDAGGAHNEEVVITSVSPPSAQNNATFSATITSAGSISGSVRTFSVNSTSGLNVGDVLSIPTATITYLVRVEGVITSTSLSVTAMPAPTVSGTASRVVAFYLQSNLANTHAVGERINRQGASTIKDVVYRTTSQAQKITINPVDKGIVIRLRHEALFTQQGSGIGSKTLHFLVKDRVSGTAVWSNPTDFYVTDRRRGQFYTELAYTPASANLRHEEGTLEILIVRVTPLDGLTESSRTFVDAVIEVSDGNAAFTDQPDRFGYPGVATLGMTLVATEQFSGGPPTVTVVCKGRTCRTITAGVISTTETYTSNTAWVVLDMLTSTRYGMGDAFADSQIDTESFEAWADYCDQLVDDGAGGTHVRYSFDGKFDRAEPRFDAAQRAAATAWCTLILVGGTVKAMYEHADDPGTGHPRPRVQLFTMANILRDTFALEWLNTEARPTVYNVQILNRERDYEQDSIAVLDTESRGANDPTNLTPLVAKPETYRLEGVVRAQQARRDAIRRHRINRLLKRKVTFEAPLEAVALSVGDRFAVQYGAMRWRGPGPVQTTLQSATLVGATSCVVYSTDGFAVGDYIQFEPNTVRVETAIITTIDTTTLTIGFLALSNAHNANGAVVDLGGGVTTTCAGSNSASGQNLLNVASTNGINANDEVWIEPGTGFEERAFVQAVASSTQLRLASNLAQTHTTARAGTVVNLTAPQFTARTSRAFTGGTTTDLYLDVAVTIPTTLSAVVFLIRTYDGTIEQRTVTAAPGTYAADTAISFSGGAINHHRGAPVAIGVDGQVVRDFICQQTTLTGDSLRRKVEGLEYVAEVYADDTTAMVLGDDTTNQSAEVATDAATIPEATIISDVTAKQAEDPGARGIDVHWHRDLADQAAPSKVWWRRVTDNDSDGWHVGGETTGQFLNLPDCDEAGVTYEVVVTPKSQEGAYPDPDSQTPVEVTIYEGGARFPAAVPTAGLVAADLGG